MNVVLCSLFRNASPYLSRYCKQIAALAEMLDARGDRFETIWCEGDSTDDTWQQLETVYHIGYADFAHWPGQMRLFKHNHGGADYGSVVHPQRFKQLADCCNAVWRKLPVDAEAVIWAESDLIWDAATMVALLDSLADYPAVGPMILLRRDGYHPDYHYDTWGTRKDGKHISPTPPYFSGWDRQQPLRVDSTGSVLVMRGEIARQVAWPEEDVIVGLCRQVYEAGGSVWLHGGVRVIHQ